MNVNIKTYAIIAIFPLAINEMVFDSNTNIEKFNIYLKIKFNFEQKCMQFIIY